MKSQQEVWNNLYKKNKNLWNRESNSLPHLMKNKKVLEIGVGNGKTLLSIVKQKPLEVTAIDISREAVRICKSQFKDRGIIFKKENIIKSKLKSNSYDIIVCCYVLDNLKKEERIKAISKMYRLIKEKGIILFEDFQQGDFRQKEGKQIETNTIIKNNQLIHHFFTKREVKQLFNKFKSIKIREKSFHPFRNNKNLERRIISAVITK